MRIGILGPLIASDEGRELELGGGRQRTLLALLVLHADQIVPVDRLIDELWGADSPRSAAKIVQGYVSQLRRVLPPDTIATHDSGYRLHGIDTDAGEFERLIAEARTQAPRDAVRTLSAANGLWRGRPLGEVGYEAWAQAEIARLEELRLVALEERVAAELELGEAASIVPELETLVTEHPLREGLRGQLMLALYRSGRQADALKRYVEGRRSLVEELGIEPGPELRQLQQRILTHDPTLDRAAHPLVRDVRRLRLRVAAAAAILVGTAVASILVFVQNEGRSHRLIVPRDSVAVVDPALGRSVARLPVGGIPGPLVLAHGRLWVVDAVDRTISEFDTRTLTRLRTIGLNTVPYNVATAAGALWLGNAFDGTVSRLDLATGMLSQPFRPEPSSTGRLALLDADGSLWIGSQDNAVTRLDPATNAVQAVVHGVEAPLALAATRGAIWAIEAGRREVVELSTRTNRVLRRVRIGGRPIAVAIVGGAPWVLTAAPARVWRVDEPSTPSIPVGANPSELTSGFGRLWIASSQRGTLAEVDPQRRAVLRTSVIAQPLGGLASGSGRLWLAVT